MRPSVCIPTFIEMAYHLGFTPKEIAEACKEAGDAIFSKLIPPVEIEPDDMRFLSMFKKLDIKKKVLIMDMMESLVA